jgi:hypothetical protein
MVQTKFGPTMEQPECSGCGGLIELTEQFIGIKRQGIYIFYHPDCALREGIYTKSLRKLSSTKSWKLYKSILKHSKGPMVTDDNLSMYKEIISLPLAERFNIALSMIIPIDSPLYPTNYV